MMNATYFFSKGKLLLTSEYFVLDGALSLAIPTKLGQDLLVEKNLKKYKYKPLLKFDGYTECFKI